MLARVFSIAVIFSCSACTHYQIEGDPSDQRTWFPVAVGHTENMPSRSQILGERDNVVVLKTRIEGRVYHRHKLEKLIANSVEKAVSDAGANLLDREISERVKKEVLQAEKEGIVNLKTNDVADFIFQPVLHDVILYKHYTKGSVTKHKDGSVTRREGHCRFDARVNGYVYVYEVPSLQVKKVIRMYGRAEVDGLIRGRSCSFSSAEKKQWLSQAAETFSYGYNAQLKSVFNNTGYVADVRRNADGTVIIKTTLGKRLGAKTKYKVNIYQLRLEKNLITEELEEQKRFIAAGVVSDKLDDKYSWIIIDKDHSQLVHLALGDAVELSFD